MVYYHKSMKNKLDAHRYQIETGVPYQNHISLSGGFATQKKFEKFSSQKFNLGN